MTARGTNIYLGCGGGFDVRNCHGAADLAQFIAAACNASVGQAAPAKAEGWKLVPIVPTMEMMQAAWSKANELWNTPEGDDPLPGHQYRAMLDAAPSTPAKEPT